MESQSQKKSSLKNVISIKTALVRFRYVCGIHETANYQCNASEITWKKFFRVYGISHIIPSVAL